MENTLFIIHCILITLLAGWAYSASRVLKMPITIHNLPIILLTGVGLFVGAWCAKNKPEFFLPTGVLTGVTVYLINSFPVPGQTNPGFLKKICVSLLCVLFWTEMVAAFWIVNIHIKKLNAKPKS
jgi:hypothetical protein